MSSAIWPLSKSDISLKILQSKKSRMTLNLNKYGSEMQAAWKRVCDLNSDIDWALFGYEGASFTLKLVATGLTRLLFLLFFILFR